MPGEPKNIGPPGTSVSRPTSQLAEAAMSRFRPDRPSCRKLIHALLGLALLTAMMSPTAAADDSQIHLEPGPPASPVPSQINPLLVVDTTTTAGGEDDAQRAYERKQEREQENQDEKRKH
jgi:hypothetical protein